MKGQTNMSGVKEQGQYVLLPEKQVYEVEIIEVKDKESSNHDPMVSIKLMVVEGEYKDQAWVWDNILIPHLDSKAVKILGRTKHFLHCINEPYEGEEVNWNSDNWLWKRCKIRVAHEAPNEYHKKVRAVVAEYVLDEENAPPEGGILEEGPDL